jgi:hypothetical protein
MNCRQPSSRAAQEWRVPRGRPVAA